MQTIALDAMGGDHGPPVIVPAALKILAEQQDLALILVGDQQVLTRELNRHHTDGGDRLSIRHASQHVTMDELPSQALRKEAIGEVLKAVEISKALGIGVISVWPGSDGADCRTIFPNRLEAALVVSVSTARG